MGNRFHKLNLLRVISAKCVKNVKHYLLRLRLLYLFFFGAMLKTKYQLCALGMNPLAEQTGAADTQTLVCVSVEVSARVSVTQIVHCCA